MPFWAWLLALLWCIATPARADPDPGYSSTLWLVVEDDGTVEATLTVLASGIAPRDVVQSLTATDLCDRRARLAQAAVPNTIEARCQGHLAPYRWTFEAAADLEDLERLLSDSGQTSLYVCVFTPDTPILRFQSDGWQALTPGRFCRLIDVKDDEDPGAVVSFSPNGLALAWVGALAALLILGIPIWLAWRLRHALRAERDRPAAWFGFSMERGWVQVVAPILWLAGLSAASADRLCALLFAGLSEVAQSAASIGLILLPIAVPLAAAEVTGARANRIVGRPAEPRKALARWFAMLLIYATLIGMRVLTTVPVPDQDPFWLLLVVWGAIGGIGLGRLVSRRRPARRAGAGQPVPAGLPVSLARRVRAQSAALGVSAGALRMLDRPRVANAFVTRGRTITYTRYLVESCAQAEVDTVTVMEFGRIALRHIPILILTMIPVMAVLMAGLILSGPAGAVLLVGYLGLLLARQALSRRLCLQRDRWSARRTEAGTLVTALIRLSRLNDQPLRWRWWWTLLVTHPDHRTRIAAIAAASGLDDAALAASIAAADLPATEPYAGDPDPAAATPRRKRRWWPFGRRRAPEQSGLPGACC